MIGIVGTSVPDNLGVTAGSVDSTGIQNAASLQWAKVLPSLDILDLSYQGLGSLPMLRNNTKLKR